jgi:hypothetical protein
MNAVFVISSFCFVYAFSAVNSHGKELRWAEQSLLQEAAAAERAITQDIEPKLFPVRDHS